MKNVLLNVLGVNPTDGDYGVEIEAEGTNLPTFLPQDWWRVEHDDSLKAGMEGREYVMTKPRSLKGVRDALDVLQKAYKESATKVQETITSGVHVHVNVQQLTPKQLFTFITAYFMLEELLVTYCGPWREGNHFCLRAKDAEWIVHELAQSALTKKFGNLKTDNLRYCSLNTCSLFLYGSVEFRAMRGTPDLDAIYEWVEILDAVKNNSLEFPTPNAVVESMSFSGEADFVKRLLGDKAKFFLKNPRAIEMVRQGARIIQPLAYATDWNLYKDVNNNPFAKEI